MPEENDAPGRATAPDDGGGRPGVPRGAVAPPAAAVPRPVAGGFDAGTRLRIRTAVTVEDVHAAHPH
ncbi:hypothetical protein SAMN05216505_102561 [Streptomyces prasinopilosus]|uniref:Uncharacterized protein n=1 Tax=Streptomyces prasinopilosus TaxID=67344 RepID=A0A1G6MIQ1_9ACTN|nr:hypothetical protein SAMN05216505_102561 [Streptomyces prasinopilosus]